MSPRFIGFTNEEKKVGQAVAHLQTSEGKPPSTSEVAIEARMDRGKVYTILNSQKFGRFTKYARRGRDKIYSLSPEMKLQFLSLGITLAGLGILGYSIYAHEKADQNRLVYQQSMNQQEFDRLMRETSLIQQNQGIIAGNQIYLNGELRRINTNLEGVGARQRYLIQQNDLVLDNQGVLYDRQGQIYELVDVRTGQIIEAQSQLGTQVNLELRKQEQQILTLESQLRSQRTTTKDTQKKEEKKKEEKKKDTKKKEEKKKEEKKKSSLPSWMQPKKKKEKKKTAWGIVLPWL